MILNQKAEGKGRMCEKMVIERDEKMEKEKGKGHCKRTCKQVLILALHCVGLLQNPRERERERRVEYFVFFIFSKINNYYGYVIIRKLVNIFWSREN